MTELKTGNRVSFWSRGELVSATVLKINSKTITVELGDGTTRRVAKGKLQVEPSYEDNVIPFPAHGRGIGRRVWFVVHHRYPMSGTISEINRHGAKVVPDQSVVEYFWVTHPYIYRTQREAMNQIRESSARQPTYPPKPQETR